VTPPPRGIEIPHAGQGEAGVEARADTAAAAIRAAVAVLVVAEVVAVVEIAMVLATSRSEETETIENEAEVVVAVVVVVVVAAVAETETGVIAVIGTAVGPEATIATEVLTRINRLTLGSNPLLPLLQPRNLDLAHVIASW